MYGITSIKAVDVTGFSSHNVQQPINSKGRAKCTECTNCKEMICGKKKRRVSSVYEANNCNDYSKLSFASFLKR